eukprot:scaffold7369_cov61-Phaeocystis_antarctica.AAC.1
MTFLDHLGSSWPSAEAQRVRQSSKVHMARSRNRWHAVGRWVTPSHMGWPPTSVSAPTNSFVGGFSRPR